VKEFPQCFADVLRTMPQISLEADLVSFGYVVCWSVAKAICEREGKLDRSLRWLIDGKIRQGLHFLQGPYGPSQRFLVDDADSTFVA
jgi:hypothetical protein